MGKFGPLAAKGACPAFAGALASRSTMRRNRRLMIMTVRSFRSDATRGGRLVGRHLEKGAHIGDLLPLLDDDRLREAPQPLIATVLQLHESHLDRTLVMRDHHPRKIAVDIAARRSLHSGMHVRVHPAHLP